MRAPRRERLAAATAMEARCQRCGAARPPGHAYCLECGARLPGLAGALPLLRRRWIMRLGWYPGDAALVTAGTLIVALAGAIAAIVVVRETTPAAGATVIAGTALASPPAGRSRWTIILGSYPVGGGDTAARATAAGAAKKRLRGVGLLSSSDYPSLQPGYLVVFAGSFATEQGATAALGSVRSAGFAGAYVRWIAR